jgi:hypothetical protein
MDCEEFDFWERYARGQIDGQREAREALEADAREEFDWSKYDAFAVAMEPEEADCPDGYIFA